MLGYIVPVLTAFLILAFVLPVIPGVIDLFVNDPNAKRPSDPTKANQRLYPASQFGLFTYLQPGQVKMIERGGRFVRAIMLFPGHMFMGERGDNDFEPNHREYWGVVKTETKFSDSHPLPRPKFYGYQWLYAPARILFWLWTRWVYKWTGAVFIGVYPFQRIRVYPMEKYVITTSDGSDGQKRGTIILVEKRDWSDHYRVGDFQFPVIVPKADTRDKVPVGIIVNYIARTYNAYITAYFTDDDWSSRLLASVTNAVTAFTRPTPLDDVLSAMSTGSAAHLSDAVSEIGKEGGSAWNIGIETAEGSPPQVLDISPTDEDHQAKLSDFAFAKIDRASAEERAKGNAAYVRETGKALKKFPEAAGIPGIEGTIRAVNAAKEGTTIILNAGGPTAVDPIQVQILEELRKQNRSGGAGGTP